MATHVTGQTLPLYGVLIVLRRTTGGYQRVLWYPPVRRIISQWRLMAFTDLSESLRQPIAPSVPAQAAGAESRTKQ